MLRRILIGAVIAALLFRGVLALAAPQNILGVYVLMPARMDGLALGGLIAITLRDSPEALKKRFIPMIAAVCAIIFALIWNSHIPVLVKAFSYTFLDSAFAGLLILVITGACPPLTAICRWKPLAHIGVISYGLYVVHLSLYRALDHWSAQFLRLPAGDLLEVVLACASAITIAELSWRFFESPFLKLKDQFTVR